MVVRQAEKDPKLQEQEEASKEPVNKGGSAYIDELPVRARPPLRNLEP